MHIPRLSPGYERTCADCGHAWRVPGWAARPPLKGLPLSNRGGGRANAVVAGNAELAEKAAVFRQCPACDSTHYKQRMILF